ncbi:MAG: TolC family protein [Acidobacteria bacterium]|nr:TolC family protein [Acidobacteriota bacterium]
MRVHYPSGAEARAGNRARLFACAPFLALLALSATHARAQSQNPAHAARPASPATTARQTAQTPTPQPTPVPQATPQAQPIPPPSPTPTPSTSPIPPAPSAEPFVLPTDTAQEDGLSFEQLYEIAARDNLHLRAVRARHAVAEAGVRIAGERPNPELNVAYTRSEPRLNTTVTQPIEIGGQRARRVEVARNELRLSDMDVDAALRDLRHDLRVAYFNLALARNARDLGRRVVEQANRLVGIAEARFAAGDVARFEVLQARLAAARAAADLTRLENNERVALAAINQLLNRAPDAPLPLAVSLFVARPPVSTPQLIGQSLAQNVELRQAEQQIATEQSRLRLARAERIPTPSIGPGIEAIDPSLPHNYAWTMQVTVPLPVFNRGNAEVARSNALVEQLTLERDDARQRISALIGQASLRLEAARQQVDLYETRLLPDAERVRALAEEAYRAGETGLLPVIDAQRSALEIRQGYLQALFDYQSALADLEQTAGVPLR